MTAPDPTAELDALLRRAVHDLGDEFSCEAAVVLGPEYRWSMASVGGDAAALAALQFTLWDGPGPDVVTGGVPVVVDDLAEAQGRWPLLVAGRGRLAVRSVAVLPLTVTATSGPAGPAGGAAVGAAPSVGPEPPATPEPALLGLLTVTSRRVGAFDDLDIRLWTAVARVAAIQAERATAWWSDAELGGGPAGWQVSTAVGITAALDDLSAADALATLRARAFEEGRTLEEVADEVVAAVTRRGSSPVGRSGRRAADPPSPPAPPAPAGPTGDPAAADGTGPVGLVLTDPVDRDGVAALATRVAAALRRLEGGELVVDVGRAGFLGRHALQAIERCAGEHATPVVLLSASAETRRVAAILGLRWVRATLRRTAVR